MSERDLAGLAEDDLPVNGLAEALPHLRRPFERAAVRWKVQSAGDGYGIVIAYIDARLVIERLNLVVGYGWQDEYRAHAQGVEECALTLYGVTRQDVGTGQGPQSAKAMRSDALKRTAVKFGVGVSIYALKSVLLGATPNREPQGDRRLVKNREKGGQGKKFWTAELSKAAEVWLGDTYERWLDARGEKLFGPPLAHGDEEGAAGMEGEEQPPASEPVEVSPEDGAPQLDDERARAARERVKAAYAEIRKMNAAAIPPAQNRRELEEAGVSHEALEALAAERERVRDEMVQAREGARS